MKDENINKLIAREIDSAKASARAKDLLLSLLSEEMKHGGDLYRYKSVYTEKIKEGIKE